MTKHEFVATARCPMNDSLDAYCVTVLTIEDVTVEEILAVSKTLEAKSIFQEEFTRRLFMGLAQHGVVVTTVGFHSGVKTTCVIPCVSWGR